MYYSDALIEEVRQRNEIVDVISSYVRLTKKGSNYFGLCPFHNEKSASFSVTPGKQMFYCFGCGEGGNVISFLQKYENYTFQEAVEFLADRAGVELPKVTSETDQKRDLRRKRLLDVNKEAGKYYYSLLRHESGQHALAYLRNRGLSDETIQRFGLGFARPGNNETYRYLRSKGFEDDILKDSGLFNFSEKNGMTDKFWNRVIFPIMDANSRIIGFGGRVMGSGEPKYLNSPETEIFDKGRNLFGLNYSKSSKQKYMILCEGYMDVISMHQAGFTSAVASLGTAFTGGQAKLISRYVKEVMLCYDSDGAGVSAALRALPILRAAGITAKVINMRPYKDPDEFIKALGADEFAKRIEEAENSFYYELRMLQRDYDLSDPDSRTRFFNEVAKYLLRFEDDLERENYVSGVARLYEVNRDSLQKLVVKYAMKGDTVVVKAPPKSGTAPKGNTDDGAKVAQQMFITWLSDSPQIFEQVAKYVTPDDFTEEIYRKVAEMLYEQLRNNALNPAYIVSMFPEGDDQAVVAKLFHTSLERVSGKAEREKALKEIIANVKKARFLSESSGSDDESMDALTKMLEEKKQLEALNNITIHLSE